ncbi:hyccin-like isoform X4 [Amphibalanus amphitrite]|uniref:hyccin-like isoform X4 n=1 Tax=Amphibalanus amphitrite TaxID=1232801 RepID=UPI001C92A6DC|nr:hyccin-like isoform X4 [Amphibalanus amphitrite]XP_043200861.1 hyccin-like isoform X4 [Amphibalanus amphitrite]XP_043200869.1 hyccin-like isoform X4 [Amphibalanus amphitrite]
MADSPIHEWIQEWQSIKPLDVKSYAANLMADHETTAALLRVFEDPNLHHLLDDVCGQLLTFYRSREPNLVHFSLQCLPPLMHAYLNAVATRNQKTSKPTETLLLGMYNLEVVDERGQPRVVSFRMPTLIKQSVYHMPLHMAPSSLTEHSLSRLELGDAFSVEWGPLPQAQRIRASNRQQVLSALMTVYNRYLSQMSEPALQAACRAIIRICGQGFTMTAPPLDPRLTVSSDLQLEFLHAIYFIMYETVTAAATQALEAVTFRGQYDVSAKVTVAANAMRNSLNISPAGLTDSQLNLTELPSVTSLPAAVNKFIITNASFRTKKLPDDIPIQPGAAHDGEPLSVISEQTEDDQTADAPAAKSRLKERKHRPAERERSGPDKHVTAMLAALPGLVKKRGAEEKKRLDSGGDRAADGVVSSGTGAGSGAAGAGGAGEKSKKKGDSKRSGRRTGSGGGSSAPNGTPSSARNSLALNGDEEWPPGPPLARLEPGELRVVSSGSESATPRRERRETDSSSVTSTASDEAVGHGRSEPAVVYSVRRESLAVTANARTTDV